MPPQVVMPRHEASAVSSSSTYMRKVGMHPLKETTLIAVYICEK